MRVQEYEIIFRNAGVKIVVPLQDETDSIAETDSDRERGDGVKVGRGAEMETEDSAHRAINLSSAGSRPSSTPASHHGPDPDNDTVSTNIFLFSNIFLREVKCLYGVEALWFWLGVNLCNL